MSWLFSQALVAEYSAVNSLDGEQSVPLSVMPTPHKFSRNDKTMDPSRLSQFGLMCAVLTEDRGTALLTSFLEASRARTSVRPARALESRESDQAFGGSSQGSSEKSSQLFVSLKTPLFSEREDWKLCWKTLPAWGSMRSGELLERTKPEHLTSETGCGFWLTPKATDTGWGENSETFVKRNADRGDHCFQSLPAQARGLQKVWPTPTCNMVSGGPNHTSPQVLAGRHGINLKCAVMAAIEKEGHPFATPQARDFRTGQQKRFSNPDRSKNLNDQIGGQLNPPWVEWLMGWPIGWTDLEPLGTDKSQPARP